MAPWTTLLLLLTAHTLVCGEEMIRAANKDASPTNQRRAYGNACGPASLLNAFHYGSENWQSVFRSVPGHNSNTRIRHLISTWGNRPSNHINGVNRWNLERGINLVDLHDIANEMCRPHRLPDVKYEILAGKKDEQRSELLKRSHALITGSLNEGLPPIVSIQRYAHKESKELDGKSWWPLRAHFIVIIGVSKTLDPDSAGFNIRYVDPYGGLTRQGSIHIDTAGFTNSPFLGATLPSALIGKSLLGNGEQTVLTCSAIMGHW